MVNRSVAKRAKHAKPALRKEYWAKSGSSVLAVALAASLVPVGPAIGDEGDAAVIQRPSKILSIALRSRGRLAVFRCPRRRSTTPSPQCRITLNLSQMPW